MVEPFAWSSGMAIVLMPTPHGNLFTMGWSRVLRKDFISKVPFLGLLAYSPHLPIGHLSAGVLLGAYFHQSSMCRGSIVAQRYVGSVSSNVHQPGIEPSDT
jgi:hypothetical protein